MPASTSAPRARSTSATDRPDALQEPPRLRARLRRGRRDRLRARARRTTTETLRPGARPARRSRRSRMHQPPQGYFHVGDDAGKLFDAVLQLREIVGEFEKPKFFHYKPKLCAHSRNEQIGCTACIDVCSARAIRSDAIAEGQGRRPRARGVEDHAGHAAARRAGRRHRRRAAPVRRLRRLHHGVPERRPGLCHAAAPSTTASACAPCSRPTAAPAARTPRCCCTAKAPARRLIGELGRAARVDTAIARRAGARAAAGAVAHRQYRHRPVAGGDRLGASQVWVLMTDEEAPEYRQALAEQMASRAGDPDRAGLSRRAPAS